MGLCRPGVIRIRCTHEATAQRRPAVINERASVIMSLLPRLSKTSPEACQHHYATNKLIMNMRPSAVGVDVKAAGAAATNLGHWQKSLAAAEAAAAALGPCHMHFQCHMHIPVVTDEAEC